MPNAPVNSSKPTLTNRVPKFQFMKRNVPFSKRQLINKLGNQKSVCIRNHLHFKTNAILAGPMTVAWCFSVRDLTVLWINSVRALWIGASRVRSRSTGETRNWNNLTLILKGVRSCRVIGRGIHWHWKYVSLIHGLIYLTHGILSYKITWTCINQWIDDGRIIFRRVRHMR